MVRRTKGVDFKSDLDLATINFCEAMRSSRMDSRFMDVSPFSNSRVCGYDISNAQAGWDMVLAPVTAVTVVAVVSAQRNLRRLTVWDFVGIVSSIGVDLYLEVLSCC